MKKAFQLTALLFLVLASACSKNDKNKVVIEHKNFADEIQQVQNLVFRFSHDIVPDTLVGNWDTTHFIEFTPPVKGLFKFTASNELIFSPAKEFAASTDYIAALHDDLLKDATDKDLFVDDEKFIFHTPYLNFERFDAYWAREQGQVMIKMNLFFNYKVNPQEVAKLLKLKIGEADINFNIQDGEPAKQVAVTVAAGDRGQEDILIKATIAKGLTTTESDYKSKTPFEFSQYLSSRFELQVLGITSTYIENQSQVVVSTSQELLPGNIKSYYSISPFIATQAELTSNGLIVTGDFELNTSYQFTFNTKAEGVLGGKLKEDYTREVYFGELPPSLAFTNSKAIYLTNKGEMNVGINITSVDKVKLKVFKIYENNILAYMRSNRYSDYYYDDYYYDYYDYEDYGGGSNYNYREDTRGHYSDVIIEKEIDTKNLPKVGNVSAYNLGFDENKDYKGIYLISIASDEEYYLRATKLVSISDIGLIVKQYGNSLLVYANSIKTAEPLSGVNLNLISSNNQKMITITTGNDGIARVDELDKKAAGFKLAMITAKTKDDFNYLMLDQTNVETSRFDVSGKRDNISGFDAYLYPERDLYRPGEKVHGNVIIRDAAWNSVGEIPIKIKMVMPNGKEYETIKKTTNKQGASDFEFETLPSDVTGNYSIEIYNGNDVLLVSRSLNIEEFMPDRIKVRLETNKESYRLGDTIKVTTQANNLFGPPASDRNYDTEIQLSRKAFNPKDYSNYNFHIDSKTTFETDMRTGKTDMDGIAVEKFYLSTIYKDMGVLEARVYTTVFDETGRPVNRLKRLNVYTQDVFFGTYIQDYYVSTNQAMNIQLAALDKNFKPVTGAKAKVEIVRIEWQSVVERRNGTYQYVSRPQEKTVSTRDVTFNAKGAVNFKYVPLVSGEYEVRVYRPGAKNYTVSRFYSYTWGNTTNTSFEVSTEGEVLIEMDKEKYNVGDRAKVLFKAPFNGKLLITLERNDVIEQFIVNTDKKSAEITFDIKEEYLPNIYVTATLIKPLDNSTMPLTVAHGFKPILVEKPSTILPVEIQMAEKSRSKTKQTVKIKTKPEENIEVTVAVVDEGILQIKGFETPDPHGYFYQRKALEVKSYDIFAYLFPELSLKSNKSTGGDGDDAYGLSNNAEREKRLNPLSNNRVKLVSYWSGILKTNSKGEATYTFDIPQFSGDLRVMVVAYKNKAFGSAEANMKVADPLVISAGVPRFANLGDELKVPVNIVNTTDKEASATATITVTGPLNITSETTKTVKVPANREGWAEFSLKADKNMGNSSIKISVKGLGETFVHDIDLTVRPSVSLQKITGAGVLTGNDTKGFKLNNDFIPSTATNKLVISNSPMVQFIDKFDDLVRYPHGCLEQTVSKAFPQIYFAEFMKQMGIGKRPLTLEGETELNPNFNVRSAIQKVEGLQRYDGGFSYWYPGSYESWWSSVFAIHFLVEAKRAGFDVNQNVLDKGMSYLTYKSNSKQTETYVYYNNGTRYEEVRAKRETIYSLYVLSLMGKPNTSVMNYYKSNQGLLTVDGMYLLAGAYSLRGDNSSYRQILPNQYATDYSAYAFGGSFYSPIRNQAIALATLVEVDPNNPQVPEMAKHLSEQIRGRRYLSTQESVFTFLALGKISKRANASTVKATVTVDGKVIGNYNGKTDLIITNNLNQADVLISTSGTGALYYFWETEGVSASGNYTQEDNYLRARRTYYDRFGRVITNNSFNQNDLIVVELTVKTTTGDAVENIVLTDMLPAGFEIENPRLTNLRGMEWIKGQTYPDHFDVRDDRIHYYLKLGTNQQAKFYYMVRAVSKGNFKLGPVMADAMYFGEYHSYNGGGMVMIK